MLTRRHRTSGSRPAGQRGLSLVELMVGIAVGLIVVAGAVLIVSTQLGNNRRLLLETQLQQDLRATADIITRELRRVGYWHVHETGLWYTGTVGVAENPFSAVTPASGATSDLEFYYRRRLGDTGPFGFKLDTGVIRSRIGGGWQDLTDGRVMQVTAFTIDVGTPQTYVLPCPRLCADGTGGCWPTMELRTATVAIAVQSATDPAVVRNLTSSTRLRNDRIRFNDPLFPTRVCPV